MLDENLPTFFLKPSTDGVAHHSTFYLSQYGSELEPAYSLHRFDPSLPAAKNCYCVALFDPFNSDILFAEVLLNLEWTQPTASAEQIRLHGGVPPPPQPHLPSDFNIQLYNPDQQVEVKQKSGSWGSSSSWEFQLPQQTFRQPSVSAIDRARNDPTAAETTPKVTFRWKKDGKLSRDLVCTVSGKSTTIEAGNKKSSKEPDITIALFRNLKEMTVYEPNLARVELEDPKGLEVVLMLSAVSIRDVYFGNIRETFNLSSDHRKGSRGSPTSPIVGLPFRIPTNRHDQPHANSTSPPNPQPNNNSSYGQAPRPTIPPRHEAGPPFTNPRTQWEIDAESARLKKQQEAERRKAERAEQKEVERIKRMLEAEEKEERRRQAEINKETARLQKEYAEEQRKAQKAHGKYRNSSAPPVQPARPQSAAAPATFWGYPAAPQPQGPYLQPPGPGQQNNASMSTFFGGGGLRPEDERRNRHRRSIFGLRSQSDEAANKLTKKKSSLF
ncbi:MAG: hypothetical protein M1824_005602 [Vezdaea acicularis]|nr:MAG: hypothetical protein M1824_005602 [Vezdaea acicularis]